MRLWRDDPRRARAVSGAALALLAITAVIWSGLWPRQGGVGIHTVFAGAAAAMLAATLARGGDSGVAAALRWPALGWLGRRSYAVYLFHLPVVGSAHAVLFGAPPRIVDGATALATLASLAVTLALAEMSWRIVEARAIGFGRRFAYDGGADPRCAAAHPAATRRWDGQGRAGRKQSSAAADPP
jgi:peptidoglycan/LPS O-acetylase OafA/YrhL